MCTGGLKQECVLQRETLNPELRPVIYVVTLCCDSEAELHTSSTSQHNYQNLFILSIFFIYFLIQHVTFVV